MTQLLGMAVRREGDYYPLSGYLCSTVSIGPIKSLSAEITMAVSKASRMASWSNATAMFTSVIFSSKVAYVLSHRLQVPVLGRWYPCWIVKSGRVSNAFR